MDSFKTFHNNKKKMRIIPLKLEPLSSLKYSRIYTSIDTKYPNKDNSYSYREVTSLKKSPAGVYKNVSDSKYDIIKPEDLEDFKKKLVKVPLIAHSYLNSVHTNMKKRDAFVVEGLVDSVNGMDYKFGTTVYYEIKNNKKEWGHLSIQFETYTIDSFLYGVLPSGIGDETADVFKDMFLEL